MTTSYGVVTNKTHGNPIFDKAIPFPVEKFTFK